MTRDEHLKKVEELLAGTWEPDVFVGRAAHWRAPTAYAVSLAQVHATLALAMAPAPSVEAFPPKRRRWWSR